MHTTNAHWLHKNKFNMPPQSLICRPESLTHLSWNHHRQTTYQNMLRNGFLESKFAHIKSPRVPNFCKHIMLSPAGINFKQWIDMNTKGSSQITSIKEPPQKQHLAESCLGYTAEGAQRLVGGWVVRGWGMSPSRTFQDDLRHESWTVPSDLKWAALGSRSAGTTLHVLALCVTLADPVWRLMLTGQHLGDSSMGGQVSLSFSSAQPPHTFGYSCPDDKQVTSTFSL